MIQRRAERKGRTGESRNSRLEPSGCLDDHPADLAFITGNSAMLCMSSWRCLCVKAWGDKVVCKLNITPITQEKYGKKGSHPTTATNRWNVLGFVRFPFFVWDVWLGLREPTHPGELGSCNSRQGTTRTTGRDPTRDVPRGVCPDLGEIQRLSCTLSDRAGRSELSPQPQTSGNDG